MAYIYRFKDINEQVIYVGYTGKTLGQRMNQHFTKGHLPKQCYNSVAKIEYQKYETKSDAQIMEIVMINKYKPKFNKLNKQNDNITFNVEEKDWKLYRVLRASKEREKITPFAAIVGVVYLLLILLYFLIK